MIGKIFLIIILLLLFSTVIFLIKEMIVNDFTLFDKLTSKIKEEIDVRKIEIPKETISYKAFNGDK